MKFPSHKCSMAFCSLTIHNDNTLPIRLYTKSWPYYRTRPFTELREVSIEHCDGWGMQKGDAQSSGNLVPSHLRLAYVLLVEPFFHNLFVISGQFTLKIPSTSRFRLSSSPHNGMWNTIRSLPFWLHLNPFFSYNKYSWFQRILYYPNIAMTKLTSNRLAIIM